MDNKQHDSRELSDQELMGVSGGAIIADPNQTNPAADDSDSLVREDNSPINNVDVNGLINEKLKAYSENYGYPKYNSSES